MIDCPKNDTISLAGLNQSLRFYIGDDHQVKVAFETYFYVRNLRLIFEGVLG